MRTAATARAGLILAIGGAGLLAAGPATAQINSYGSGLQSSETLSTPPARRHGGYWNSTAANRSARTRAAGSASTAGVARPAAATGSDRGGETPK